MIEVEDLEEVADGLRVQVRRSKTDQEGQGAVVPVVRGRRACPVEAVNDWMASAGITTGPVFRRMGRGGRVFPGSAHAVQYRPGREALCGSGWSGPFRVWWALAQSGVLHKRRGKRRISLPHDGREPSPSCGDSSRICSASRRVQRPCGRRVALETELPKPQAVRRIFITRALRIGSPNQTEPLPSTVSSAWFRSPYVAFYHFRSGPVISGKVSLHWRSAPIRLSMLGLGFLELRRIHSEPTQRAVIYGSDSWPAETSFAATGLHSQARATPHDTSRQRSLEPCVRSHRVRLL